MIYMVKWEKLSAIDEVFVRYLDNSCDRFSTNSQIDWTLGYEILRIYNTTLKYEKFTKLQ